MTDAEHNGSSIGVIFELFSFHQVTQINFWLSSRYFYKQTLLLMNQVLLVVKLITLQFALLICFTPFKRYYAAIEIVQT